MSFRFKVAVAGLAAMAALASGPQAQAVIVSVTDNAAIGSLTGTFQFSYDSALTGTDAEGGYADPNHGLLTFNLDIGGNDFTLSQVYGLSVSLPVVLLPGNTNLNADAPGGYSAEGAWYNSVSGISFGVGRLVPLYEVTGVTGIVYSGSGSTTVTSTSYNGAITPGMLSVTDIETPEPGSLAVLASGLFGLAALRRRSTR